MFVQTKTSSVFDPGLAFSYWGVLIPHGTGRNCQTLGAFRHQLPEHRSDPCQPAAAGVTTWANAPTLAMYRAGGSGGLNCPGDGRLYQLTGIPGALGAGAAARQPICPSFFLASRPLRRERSLRRAAAHDDDAPASLAARTNETTNWQLIFGGKGEVGLKDWTYDLYTSFGSSRVEQGASGAVSYGKLRALVSMPNYGNEARGWKVT